jgi:hypothetical protein
MPDSVIGGKGAWRFGDQKPKLKTEAGMTRVGFNLGSEILNID